MLRPMTVAPMPAVPRSKKSSSTPVSPPDSPNMARPPRVWNTHSCSSGPPTPSGFSSPWSGPAPKPSREMAKLWTRSLGMRVLGGGRHPLAHDAGRAAGLHGDAVEAVGRLHSALLVGDDEQLGLVAELVHEVEEAVQVDVVEGGLDLVEQVERRRAAAEDGEQERQGGEGALAAREQREVGHG